MMLTPLKSVGNVAACSGQWISGCPRLFDNLGVLAPLPAEPAPALLLHHDISGEIARARNRRRAAANIFARPVQPDSARWNQVDFGVDHTQVGHVFWPGQRRREYFDD